VESDDMKRLRVWVRLVDWILPHEERYQWCSCLVSDISKHYNNKFVDLYKQELG
jgi:hypothetical protein